HGPGADELAGALDPHRSRPRRGRGRRDRDRRRHRPRPPPDDVLRSTGLGTGSVVPMAERPLRFERRMSDAEALMWTMEKDAALRSSFLQVTLLDRAPDFAAFRERMERAVRV